MAGFITVALFTGALGAYAIAAMSVVNEQEASLYTDDFGGLDLLAQYTTQAGTVERNVLAYVLTNDPTVRQTLREQMADADARMSSLAVEIDAVDEDRADVGPLDQMTSAWQAYTQWRDNVVFGAIGDSARASANAAYYADGLRLTQAFAQAADTFRVQKGSVAELVAASGAAAYQQLRSLAILLSVTAVGMALVIGFLVWRSILRPVRQVGSAAARLALGELDEQPDVRSHDELGRMADAFRDIVAYQKDMAAVATAIAEGNLYRDIQPKSASDVLGTAFLRMTHNLRTMVGELENQAATLGAQAQLLNLAHDAIIVREPDTARIRFWNRGAEEMYGWTEAEAVGSSTHALLNTEFPESSAAVDAELTRAGRWDGELIHTRKDGRRLTVASRQAVQLDASGQPTAVLAINTDVTRRIEAEAELARARDAAEAASEAKTVFLANTSHEIRTPMNAILGMAELLAETPLNAEQREYVRTFQRAGDTLLNLINDVLDLSKVEAGQLDLEAIPFDLCELVEHIAEVLAVRAHGKGLELNVHVLPDVPQYVTGDPTRLRQVVMNLIGNAIKFTDTGEVGLRVELDPNATGTISVLFSVRDTGIGIPTDKQVEIFASFAQADASTTRRHGGTGLGLAISSRIVGLMGGHMPGLDGFDVAAKLRAEAGTLTETVVMLTSDTRAGDVARARQLGLGAYLVKSPSNVQSSFGPLPRSPARRQTSNHLLTP